MTSDGALLLVRDIVRRLGLSELNCEQLTNGRRGKNAQLPLPDRFFQGELISAEHVDVVEQQR